MQEVQVKMSDHYQVSPRANPMALSSVLLHGESQKRVLRVSFSQFSREICTSEENVIPQKIFFIKFSTKMVSTKIFVPIVLTKLQRFESRVNV